MNTSRLALWITTGLVFLGGVEYVSAFSKKKPDSQAAPESSVKDASAKEVPPKEAVSKKDETVWINRADGSLQCEQDSGQKIEAAQDELEKAGVKVFEGRTGNDGAMRIQLCGSPTGNVHEFRIAKADLDKALNLKFKLGLADGCTDGHKH